MEILPSMEFYLFLIMVPDTLVSMYLCSDTYFIFKNSLQGLMFLYVIKPNQVSEQKIVTPFCISQYKVEVCKILCLLVLHFNILHCYLFHNVWALFFYFMNKNLRNTYASLNIITVKKNYFISLVINTY